LGPVSTEWGDPVQVQFPVTDIYNNNNNNNPWELYTQGYKNKIKNNNNPICNMPGASFTDPEVQGTLRNITVCVDN